MVPSLIKSAKLSTCSNAAESPIYPLTRRVTSTLVIPIPKLGYLDKTLQKYGFSIVRLPSASLLSGIAITHVLDVFTNKSSQYWRTVTKRPLLPTRATGRTSWSGGEFEKLLFLICSNKTSWLLPGKQKGGKGVIWKSRGYRFRLALAGSQWPNPWDGIHSSTTSQDIVDPNSEAGGEMNRLLGRVSDMRMPGSIYYNTAQ